MTFDELKVCMAIHRANLGFRDRMDEVEQNEAITRVFSEYLKLFGDSEFPCSRLTVLRLMVAYRKQPGNRLKAEIALAHGTTCYFANRGKGPCCGNAEWGHVVARTHGGLDTVENGQIECQAHNRQRGGRNPMTIEEYLKSDLRTDGKQTYYNEFEVFCGG